MSDTIPVTVTYLEMTSRSTLPTCPRPPGKLALLRAEKMPIHYYRYLYRLIGAPYNWVSRAMMSDQELSNIIIHERVYIYILYIDGVPAGFAEIDGRHPRIPEIKFFGLSPDFTGRGYGRFFLCQIIDLAWTCGISSPSRFNHQNNYTSHHSNIGGTAQTSLATAINMTNQISNSENEDYDPDNPKPNSKDTKPANDFKGGAERIRLETCTLDHPAALPLYQKLGFSVFDQRNGEVPLLKDTINKTS